MKIKFLCNLILVFFVILGCTPSKHFVKTHPESNLKFNRISEISVIADVCLFRDNIGDNDFWLIPESLLVANHMLNAAKNHLEKKGYNIKNLHAPFVGSYLNTEKPCRVKESKESDPSERMPPFYESDLVTQNQKFKKALLTIFPKISATAKETSVMTNLCCTGVETREAMDIIAKNVGGDATLFLIGKGKIVSMGKQLAQGLTTGLATAVLTLGMGYFASWEADVLITYAVLVDNDSGEILWSNFMLEKNMDFADQRYYEEKEELISWPEKTLYHLPLKTALSQKGNSNSLR